MGGYGGRRPEEEAETVVSQGRDLGSWVSGARVQPYMSQA